jgi:hypothetical protein
MREAEFVVIDAGSAGCALPDWQAKIFRPVVLPATYKSRAQSKFKETMRARPLPARNGELHGDH